MASKPQLQLWSRLVQAAAVAILSLSALLLLAPTAGASFFNLVYYQHWTAPEQVATSTQGYIYFANGIIGAVMVGWMTGIITLARGPFAAGQEWAWKAIALPLAVWFGVDCAFTIAHQAWGNLVLNLGTALMFGIPLAAAKKHCNRPGW
jgi:hypothetical protein